MPLKRLKWGKITMIRYKLDILDELRKRGFNSTVLRRERILGEGTITRIRRGLPPDPKTLDILCRILHRQPGSILEWFDEESSEAKTDG